MKNTNNLYQYLLFNLNSLSVQALDILLFELELNSLALYLKTKFNDKRSLSQLVNLIKSEYKLG